MKSWCTRAVTLVCWILVSQSLCVQGFQAKSSRDTTTTTTTTTSGPPPTRTAFQMSKSDIQLAPQAAPGGFFGFAPIAQGSTSYYEEEDNEVEISVGTAIMACAVSLALGFGLGYGT